MDLMYLSQIPASGVTGWTTLNEMFIPLRSVSQSDNGIMKYIFLRAMIKAK